MADKFLGSVKAGSTSVSLDVVLRSNADGLEIPALVAANLTASYQRQGGLRVAITLSDLAAVNSAYSSGGVKEIDATNMAGLYRLDVPDAALATGADWVIISVFSATSYVFYQHLALDVPAAAIQAKAASMTFTSAGKIDATIQAAGDFAQAAADKVWSSTTRTLSAFAQGFADQVWATTTRVLTAFGFNVTLNTSVWDESAAAHDAAGTTGEKLNDAASAGDPWGTALPGAYAAGSAGKILFDTKAAVWDELVANHVIVGSTGVAVAAGGAAGDPWSTALPGAYAAGTAGKIVGDRIADSVTGSVGSVAGNVAGNVVGSVGSVTGSVGSVTTVSDKTGYRLSATGVDDILRTALPEAYAADGAAATLTQILYLIQQLMAEKSISGTTMTVKKLDGSTTAATFTLNSSTTPTSITRAT